MRTKTLLLTAALGLAGAATVSAQVYSVNAVGYITLTLAPGFTMIANQLDYGTGNNTVVNTLGKQVSDGTILYKFSSASGYSINSFNIDTWDTPNDTLAPGEGAFIKIAGTAPVKVTFVGTVPQGTLTTHLVKGFQIASSQVPQSDVLTKDPNSAAGVKGLSFPAVDGDVIYRWDPTSKSYSIYSWQIDQWDTAPVVNVGEAFWVKKVAAVDWVRSFDVNNP